MASSGIQAWESPTQRASAESSENPLSLEMTHLSVTCGPKVDRFRSTALETAN